MAHKVQTIVRSGTELFDVDVLDPRTNNRTGEVVNGIFNLAFRLKAGDEAALAGGGIYAVRYRGELLYVGIFTGDRKVPFAGNVARERISKHIEALSMRGRNVGFGATNYDRAIALPEGPLVLAIRSNTAQRDNGSVRSYPCKVRFAAERWAEMSIMEKDPKVLAGFEMIYGRINPGAYAPDITYADLKSYLEVVENGLIQSCKPRCNERHAKPKLKNMRHGPAAEAWSAYGKMLADGTWASTPKPVQVPAHGMDER